MKTRFLAVDDDQAILKSYISYFKYCKEYELTTANSLKEAENLSGSSFDVAIVDGLEGICFELLPKINAKRKVILTGSEDIYKTAKDKGLEVYMKPIIKFSNWLNMLAIEPKLQEA